MHENDQTTVSLERDIELFDIFNFISDCWKTIVGIGAGAAAIGAVYVMTVTPQYEAKALVDMAQVQVNSRNLNLIDTTPIETPASLEERSKIPSTYSADNVKACGLENRELPKEALVRMVRVSLPRGLTSSVSIAVRASSPELASQCVTSVVDTIRSQQAALAKPYLDDLRHSLSVLQPRSHDGRSVDAEAKTAGLSQTVLLASRIQEMYLTQQAEELRRALGRSTPTRLISPIYVSPKPISRNGVLIVVICTIAGLVLGLAVAGGRKALGAWRSESKR